MTMPVGDSMLTVAQRLGVVGRAALKGCSTSRGVTVARIDVRVVDVRVVDVTVVDVTVACIDVRVVDVTVAQRFSAAGRAVLKGYSTSK